MANIKNRIKQCYSDPFIRQKNLEGVLHQDNDHSVIGTFIQGFAHQSPRKLVFSWGLFLGAIYIARDMAAAEELAAAEMAASAAQGVANQADKLAGEISRLAAN